LCSLTSLAMATTTSHRQEPKAFQICLEILQHEHTNTPGSLQSMLQLMNQLPQSFHELIDLDLFKVRRSDYGLCSSNPSSCLDSYIQSY
jgi:hypothetical protein